MVRSAGRDGGRFDRLADRVRKWRQRHRAGGWSTPGRSPGLEIRVYGSNGAARVELSDEYPGDEAFWIAGPDGVFEPASAPSPAGRPWYESWIGALIDDAVNEILGRDYRGDPTFADGARAQSLLAAMLLSMESGAMELVRNHP